MSVSAGTAYVTVRPDLSGFGRDVSSQVNPIAKQFGGKFGKALGPVMAQQSKHLRSFTTAAKYATIGAAGLAAYGFKNVVEAGMKFEKQMSVNSAVSEATRKQMVLMEKQSIKLGKATFYSATEAAEAQGELVKGGLKVKQVLGGGLPAALHLAEAGQLDLATAANTTVNAMKLFGLQGKEANSVADMLATAANRTTADVIDFAMAMKQGGSVTKLAGYDMNETVTVLEALAEAGIKNSDAGTSMKAATIQLLKPSKKQAELTKELNIHWTTQSGVLKSAAGISKELRRATGDMTKAERAKTLATLAGTDGVRTLNALYSETPAHLVALERANAKQGTAQDIASKKMDNLAGQVEQFKGSLETAEISIYKGMEPALRELAEEGTKAANQLGRIFENPKLSGSEKIERALELVSHELGRFWDENDVTEHLADLLDKAIPVLAEHAGKLGFEAAKGFVHGFTNADFLGKVVMGTWLLNFIGGKAAFVGLGKTMGRELGLNLGKEAARSAAPIITTGTAAASVGAGGVVPGWLGTDSRKQRVALQEAGMRTTAKQTASQALAAQGGIFSTVERDIESRWKGLGGRLARGAVTWGLGGVIVGGIANEVVGGSTGAELAAAFEGAGAGAAIGSAIAPGIGTAIGAALGGTGGALVQVLSEDGKSLGDEYAEEIGARLRKKWPEIEKQIKAMNLGTAGAIRGMEAVPNRPGLQEHIVGARGLKGARAKLRSELINAEGWDASEKVIAALRAEIAKLTHVIETGEQAVHKYQHGFDLLKSGAITRMGDINKVTQENIGHINQVWKNNPPKWHQAMSQSMKASIAAIRSGMKQEVIDTEAGQKRIKDLMRNLRLFQGRDPLGLAKGFAQSWQAAGQVNSQQINQEIGELKKMPKGAQEAAREAMVRMARTMESEGKLVKGSAARLNSALTTKFGQTGKQIQQSTAQAMAHIAQSASEGATNVGGALSNIFDNLANALAAVGADKIPHFSLVDLSTASQYHHTRESTESGFGRAPKRQRGGDLPGTFTVPGSGSGDKVPMLLPPGSFIENREAARRLRFQGGGLTPVITEPEERVWLPPAVGRVGLHNLHARNSEIPRFQKGGLAHPAILGPEPMRSLGQTATDKAFKAAQTYYRKHAEPQRILNALHALRAQVAIGWPYVYGGGHGGFHGPFDCSGLVSYGLHAADLLSTPMSVQKGSGLYTLGQAGPGKWLTWGVRGTSGANAHALDIETPILTVDGWKTMGTVEEGDHVYAEDGSPTLVTHVSEVFEGKACYEVEFADGATLVATGDHRWKVWDAVAATYKSGWRVLSTEELLENYTTTTVDGHARNRYRVAFDAVPQTPALDLPITPYIFGYWLGDGNSHKPQITVGKEDHDHVLNEIERAGYRVTKDTAVESEWGAGYQVSFVNDAPAGKSIPSLLGQLGVRGKQRKHIPPSYLVASTQQREALLAGLLDSDGCATKLPAVQFSSKRRELAHDVWLLARSLGHRASLWQTALGDWFVSWTPMTNPFRVERKREKCAAGMAKRDARSQKRDSRGRRVSGRQRMSLVAIRPVSTRPSRCIAVDHPERVFLAGRAFTPTHNTMMAVKDPKGIWDYFEAGGSGGGTHSPSGWDGSFQLRHMPGFQAGGQVGMPKKAREAVAKYGQVAFDPRSPHFVGWGFQRGGPVQKFAKGGGVKGMWAGTSIDQTYPKSDGISTGATLPGYVIEALAEWAGLPGVTMFQITEGESTGHPGMDIPDPPGRSRGLYAINDHYNSQFGATAMRNPILNTLAAKQIVGSGLPNANIWHGSSHVTGWNLHYNGDPAKIAKHIGGSGAGSDEHSFKEDVPAVFQGARTGDLNFPKTPSNLPGINKEINHWQREVRRYRSAQKAAEKANRPGVAQAIKHNVTQIEAHLQQLRSARHKQRLEKAKKAVTKALGKKLGKVGNYEQIIAGAQRDYNVANQLAEQIVDLEPQSPELPEKASATERESAEANYLAAFEGHVNQKERPAYQDVLAKAANWRNAILRAETFGFGEGSPSVSRMEATSERKVYMLDSQIESINQYTQKVAVDLAKFQAEAAKFHHDHPRAKPLQMPDWLKEEIKERDKKRDKLPFLRFKEDELRKLVGELRGSFYPGDPDHNRIVPPLLPLPGSGSLEDALTEVQGIHWPDQHELLSAAALAPPRHEGRFGGAIWDIEGTIEELGLKIQQAAGGIGGGGAGGSDEGDSERTQLLEELLKQANQRLIVQGIEQKTFAEFPPYAGKAHTGAIVPGPPTQERTMIVKGGEGIFTAEQGEWLGAAISGGYQAGGPLTIEEMHMHPDGRVTYRQDGRELEANVEQIIDKRERRGASSASRGTAPAGWR